MTLNHTNLDTLIKTLREADAAGEFDITRYVHPCGSPSCVAGYALGLHLGTDEAQPILKACLYGDATRAIGALKSNLADYLGISLDLAEDIAVGWEKMCFDDAGNRLSHWSPSLEETITKLNSLRQPTPLTWLDVRHQD